MKSIYHKIPLIISYIIIAGGILGISGWIFGIDFLKSVSVAWAQMRFVTAICFIFTGLIIFSIEKIIHQKNDDISMIFLSAASLGIILFISFFVAAKFYGVTIDIEDILTGGKGEGSLSGLSLATAYNFFLIGIVGIVALFKTKKLKAFIFAVGLIVGLIGLFGILGYILNNPDLYFEIQYISAPMAANTAFLFLLTGITFMMLGTHVDKK